MSVEEYYVGCMILSAVGDTIGYMNSIYEFNFNEEFTQENYGNQFVSRGGDFSNQLVFLFIHGGGILNFDFEGKRVSDDTVMHLATAEALLSDYKTDTQLYQTLVDKYVASMDKEMKELRAPGFRTMESIDLINKGLKWNKLPYEKYAGGSGGSMRSMCIGLAFHGKKKRKDLIRTSIVSGMITHNNAIGYLGALVSALFTAYAIERIPPKKWGRKLIELLKSDTIDKFIKKIRPDTYEKYLKDKDIFLTKWIKFMDEAVKVKPNDATKIVPAARSINYHEKYSFHKNKIYPGAGGDDSVIIAYDCLLDAEHLWEKLVYYSMLHVGDSDTTGAIAGAWYGAYYGMEKVPANNFVELEMKVKIDALARELFEKFYVSK